MSENASVESTENDAVSQEAPEFKAITSQDELDQVISKRIARERKKFADYDELKAKAEKLHEIEQGNLSDTEKAITEAVSAKEAELTSFYAEKLARAEAEKLAGTKGFRDPEDALTFVNLSDFLEGGSLNSDLLSEKLGELADKKPYLLADKEPAPSATPRRVQSSGSPVKTENDAFGAKLKALMSAVK